MTDEAPQGKPVTDPILLGTMRRAWLKWRDRMIALKAEGKKLCPGCKSVVIEKERKWCAICEFKRSGRTVTQGNPTSVEKR